MIRPIALALTTALTGALVAGPLPARADALRVVADTPVVHALAAQVMAGVGAPDLLVTGGADPHHMTLRPSEAARLAGADVILWVGPDLTPWLAEALAALAPDTPAPALLDAPGVTVRRPGFSDAAPADPHAWLDPQNARAWTTAIAETLAAADPAHAARYRANAAAADTRLAALARDMARTLAPVGDRPILVMHDAYGYLSEAFGLRIVGAVLGVDGGGAGALRLARLAQAAQAGSIACAFGEPGRPDGALRAALAGADVPVGTLDPEGRGLTPGPDLYETLMRDMATALTACAPPPA
ncbi:MAG: zinc ABC transporter substrate-binding protein [Rhodobacteraceae bacterium]|jgi:zinc transport system substrate-binding protein|nr:zinc ABC transporter substrate-binding protein [Paracoccaceae bacterium]